MPDELYRVLGVAKDAGERDIRDAYRRLAKTHHPDLNPGDKAAEETFKSVLAAYDILVDADKRRRYDAGEIDAEGNETPRHFYREYAAGGDHPYQSTAGFDDLGDVFADLFRSRGRGGGGQTIRMRGGDARYSLNIPFLDAVNGATKRLALPDGNTLDVKIPAGHRDGQVLRLKGKGMPGLGGGAAGDAYVEIRVDPHPTFRRRGNDILIDLPVGIHEAVLGAKVSVPTVHGNVTMSVPPGANSGDTLRLKGKGVPMSATRAAGDQLVTLSVVMPVKPDDDLNAFLSTWAEKHAYDPRSARKGATHDA